MTNTLDPEGTIAFVRGAVLDGTAEIYAAGGKSRDVVILLTPTGATYCARPEPAHLEAWFNTLRDQGERAGAYAAVIILDVGGIGPRKHGGVLVTLEHRDLARNPSWSAVAGEDGRLEPWLQHPGTLAKIGGQNQLLTRRVAGALA